MGFCGPVVAFEAFGVAVGRGWVALARQCCFSPVLAVSHTYWLRNMFTLKTL